MELRQSQIITTFGIGSIIDTEQQSFMPCDTDFWNIRQIGDDEQLLRIEDKRVIRQLQKLGIAKKLQYFYTPPLAELKKTYRNFNGIDAVRFPQWLYCHSCHRFKPFCDWKKGWTSKLLQLQEQYRNTADYRFKKAPECHHCFKVVNKKPTSLRHRLIPIRFIVACPKGHIDDFPWTEWLHHKNHEGCQSSKLKYMSGGGLSSIMITCEECGAYKNLGGIFKPGNLDEICKCNGSQPWRKTKQNNNCGDSLVVLQRGGSNVYYPSIFSAITVPPFSTNLMKLLRKNDIYDGFKDDFNTFMEEKIQGNHAYMEGDLIVVEQSHAINEKQLFDDFIEEEERTLQRLLRSLNKKNNAEIAFEELLNFIKQELVGDESQGNTTEDFDYEEFKAFATPESYRDEDDLQVQKQDIDDTELDAFFIAINQVKRLREVNVLTSFSRILPPNKEELVSNSDLEVTPVFIAQKTPSWLPAYEGFGEGIFIQFDKNRLNKWSEQESLCEIVSKINNDLKDEYKIKPERILLHTFSHCLIRQLSFSTGYSITAIKEKIYCAYASTEKEVIKDMNGVLIYTTSPDKNGTMGGLVRQGKPENIQKIISAAVREIQCCSNDPLCFETPSGKFNKAACFACTFLPETSCCMFNRFLDRRFLIGGDNIKGFFEDLL